MMLFALVGARRGVIGCRVLVAASAQCATTPRPHDASMEVFGEPADRRHVGQRSTDAPRAGHHADRRDPRRRMERQAARSPREAAQAAWEPSGPSINELAAEIRAE